MEKPALFIIDASIALTYFLNEKNYLRQVELLMLRSKKSECQLIAPTLLQYELGNRLMRCENITADSLNSMLELFTLINPTPTTNQKALHITNKFKNITWYDAIYHATALEYNGMFITADKKYYQATKRIGSIQFIADYA